MGKKKKKPEDPSLVKQSQARLAAWEEADADRSWDDKPSPKEPAVAIQRLRLVGIASSGFEFVDGYMPEEWHLDELKAVTDKLAEQPGLSSDALELICDAIEKAYAAGWSVLIATEDGWVCPNCEYKQGWAHEFMADDKLNPNETGG